MQLRKPATAILALALSQDWHRQMTPPPAAGSTLDKIAKNGVIVVGHRESSVLSLITTISKKWWVTRRITPTPLLKQ
ncbi:glutamate/aspartate periplasmic binding protein [Escherichia coli]|nr:glutamate/aspartate periplasmic binding protein [Escherichia coli]